MVLDRNSLLWLGVAMFVHSCSTIFSFGGTMRKTFSSLALTLTLASLVFTILPAPAKAEDGTGPICTPRESDGKCKIPALAGCNCVSGN